MKYTYTVAAGTHFERSSGTLEGSSEEDIKNQLRKKFKGQPIIFKEIKKALK